MGGTTITSLIACPFNMHGTVEPSNFMSLCGVYKMTLSWDVQTPTLWLWIWRDISITKRGDVCPSWFLWNKTSFLAMTYLSLKTLSLSSPRFTVCPRCCKWHRQALTRHLSLAGGCPSSNLLTLPEPATRVSLDCNNFEICLVLHLPLQIIVQPLPLNKSKHDFLAGFCWGLTSEDHSIRLPGYSMQTSWSACHHRANVHLSD